MFTIIPRFLFITVCALAVSSCSSTTLPIDASSTPDSSIAFVAGRFGFEWEHTAMRLAAEIDCDGVSTYIEMHKDTEEPPLRIYPIPSGECFFVGLAPMGGIGDREFTIEFGEARHPKFKVEPGNIYYLGNLRAAAFYSGENAHIFADYSASWRGRYITLNSSASSEENATTMIYQTFPSAEHLGVIAVNPLNKSSKKDAVTGASS